MAIGELQKQVGRRLRYWRTERGFTQEGLAEFLGVHRTYVGNLERGERNLTLQSVEDLAARLEVETQWLLMP